MQYNPGDILGGKYRICERIGGGAMGSVYKAEHEIMHKTVAIKVLHGDFAQEEAYRRRFRREAEAAAKLDHQNICTVMDFDTTDDGVSYLVMEYLDGESLTRRLERLGRLSPAASIRILRQLLSALQCAHDCGIVHRDVKPDNIFLIQREGADDFVKLIDFGIAHIESPSSDYKTMTRAGQIFGTPQYLAPEQAVGVNVDHRADLYACGCIFYEMLTGSTPFTGNSYIELMNKHVSEDPPHLDGSIAQSERLDAIIQRLLNKAPEVRFQSAQEVQPLLDEVQLLLSSEMQLSAVPYPGMEGGGMLPPVYASSQPDIAVPPVYARGSQPDIAVPGGADLRRGSFSDIRSSEYAGRSRWRKHIIALLIAIVVLVAVILASLFTDDDVSEQPAAPVAAEVPAAEPEAVPAGAAPVAAEPVAQAVENQELKPQPYNYSEDGFKISFDSVLSRETGILSAVENYYSMNYEEARDALEPVREKFWEHPNFLRLYAMIQDQLGLKDKAVAGIEHLMKLEPEALRNPSVAQILLKYSEEPGTFEQLERLLSKTNPPYAAYFVAWLILYSPYDLSEARLEHLTDLYNLLNPEHVPAWLRDSVRLWEFEKEDCETRLRLIREIAQKGYPEFETYVQTPLDSYRSRECKQRRLRVDCNACMRSWLDAHRPAGVMLVVDEVEDEPEPAPKAAKSASKPAKSADAPVHRKKKDSSPAQGEKLPL